jgi:hypothetical protein
VELDRLADLDAGQQLGLRHRELHRHPHHHARDFAVLERDRRAARAQCAHDARASPSFDPRARGGAQRGEQQRGAARP